MKITKRIDITIKTKNKVLCGFGCKFLSFWRHKDTCSLYADEYNNSIYLEKDIHSALPFRCKQCIKDFSYGDKYENRKK